MQKSERPARWQSLICVPNGFCLCFVASGHVLQQSFKPSLSGNQTNKGSLCTTREQIYFSLCLYSSSNTIGTSIWAPLLRHEGNTKSLLPSCIHTIMPLNGSWSEVRAEPTPPRVQRAGVALPPPHTWSCPCWQLDILAS